MKCFVREYMLQKKPLRTTSAEGKGFYEVAAQAHERVPQIFYLTEIVESSLLLELGNEIVPEHFTSLRPRKKNKRIRFLDQAFVSEKRGDPHSREPSGELFGVVRQSRRNVNRK